MRTFKISSLSNFQTYRTVSLTAGITLYVIRTGLSCFITFNHFYLSTQTPTFHLCQTPICCLDLSVHFFSFLDFTYKLDHIAFVFVWFILLSVMIRSIHVVINDWISFFCSWNISVYICVKFTYEICNYMKFVTM